MFFFFLNSKKIRSLLSLMRFQTSLLLEGEAGSLLNFSTRIFTEARNHRPRLIYPFVYILSAFFPSPSRLYHHRPPLLFLPVTTPSSLARRLISAACTPVNDKDALLCTSPTRCLLSNNPPPRRGGKQ